MSRRYYSSIAQATTLSSSTTAGATTLAITAATGLPASTPYTIIIDQDTVNEEVVEVTNRSGTTLTVTRGVDGTTAAAHSTGAVVRHGFSARDLDEPNAFINGTGVVTTTHLVDANVTTAKIADKAVTAAKVGSGAATASQTLIADGSGGASWGAAASAGASYPELFMFMGA